MALFNGVRAIKTQYVGDGNRAGHVVKLPFTPHEAEITWPYSTPSALPAMPMAVWAKKLDGADFTTVFGPLWPPPTNFDGPHALQLKYNGIATGSDALPQYLDLQGGGIFVRSTLNQAGTTYTVAARRYTALDALPNRIAGALQP